jgi:hypothetical protein
VELTRKNNEDSKIGDSFMRNGVAFATNKRRPGGVTSIDEQ